MNKQIFLNTLVPFRENLACAYVFSINNKWYVVEIHYNKDGTLKETVIFEKDNETNAVKQIG
jgi:hypothetical protein